MPFYQHAHRAMLINMSCFVDRLEVHGRFVDLNSKIASYNCKIKREGSLNAHLWSPSPGQHLSCEESSHPTWCHSAWLWQSKPWFLCSVRAGNKIIIYLIMFLRSFSLVISDFPVLLEREWIQSDSPVELFFQSTSLDRISPWRGGSLRFRSWQRNHARESHHPGIHQMPRWSSRRTRQAWSWPSPAGTEPGAPCRVWSVPSPHQDWKIFQIL